MPFGVASEAAPHEIDDQAWPAGIIPAAAARDVGNHPVKLRKRRMPEFMEHAWISNAFGLEALCHCGFLDQFIYYVNIDGVGTCTGACRMGCWFAQGG